MRIQIVANINDATKLACEAFNLHLREVYEAFLRSSITATPLEIGSRLIMTTFPRLVLPTSLVTAQRRSYVVNPEVDGWHKTILRDKTIPTKWVNCLGESHVFRRGRVQLELYPAYRTGGPLSLPFGEPKSCDLRFLVVLECMGSPELSKFVADVSARRFSVPTLVFALAD